MANILVIEDDKVIAAIVERFLIKGGHTVTTASDGKQGLRSIAANPPDLVITDVFMPEKDGLEAIRELRAERPTLPIIAISGGGTISGTDALKFATMFGAREVMTKPLVAEKVLAAVDRCLAKAG